MNRRKKILGIIPARGGSKGLPSKNILIFLGKPLIEWTIEQALKSKHLDKLIVSTDDEKIAAVSKKSGAEVPFIRPAELAKDDTPSIEPIKNVINFYLDNGFNFDYIVCLQCTSPLRTTNDINNAIELCIKSGADSVVSVCEVKYSPYWMKKVDENGYISNFIQNGEKYARRQDLPKVYRLNGAFYMATTALILESNSWYNEKTKAFIMDNIRSIDIDTELDFIIAEVILKQRNRK